MRIDESALRLPKRERRGYVLYCVINGVSEDLVGWRCVGGSRERWIRLAREYEEGAEELGLGEAEECVF